MILGVLDRVYASIVQEVLLDRDTIDFNDFVEGSSAETDEQDRVQELTGAIKLVSSLATLDGLVRLSPTLEVLGFGAKITASGKIGDVYDGRDLIRDARVPKRCDVSRFGTRHGSMLRYCARNKEAIGIVVSQDGNVRVILNDGSRMWLCDDVRLLDHDEDISGWIRERAAYRSARGSDKASPELGYTSMPKTLQALARVRRPRRGLRLL
jgi:hypothetical protein